MNYKASIVIPLLNQKSVWLEKSVKSALEQTVCTQVIVVTSPKTKESNLEVLAKLQSKCDNLLVEQCPCLTDQHFAEAINLGFLRATERVGILLSDDWLEKTTIEECLPFPTDIVGTSATVHDAEEKKLYDRISTIEKYKSFGTMEEKASYLKCFFLYRRDKCLEVGGIDKKIGLTGADDYDFIWTMLEANATVSILNRKMYHIRDHTEERLTLRNRTDQIRDLNKIYDKHNFIGPQRDKLIEKKARWFGKTLYEVKTGGKKW